MANLGWPSSWRRNCPASVKLPENLSVDGILFSAVNNFWTLMITEQDTNNTFPQRQQSTAVAAVEMTSVENHRKLANIRQV